MGNRVDTTEREKLIAPVFLKPGDSVHLTFELHINQDIDRPMKMVGIRWAPIFEEIDPDTIESTATEVEPRRLRSVRPRPALGEA